VSRGAACALWDACADRNATIINGRHDPVVPLVNAEVLDERLPDSRLLALDGGHDLFIWQ
jgi:pimeloyl-ACP methyl ester carboxylesterase